MQDDWPQRIVRWQSARGRHDLPWQNTRDPYRVWLSEIMLQQTQVVTVKDYFLRFLTRFPDVRALAESHLDEVLALWSGLGYYSRARNLHRCAVEVVLHHGGAFPQTALELQGLPGIGPSTAAAVASLCFGERVAILDGNVKRVLTRALGFGADLSLAANEKALWEHARQLLPIRDLTRSMPRYTQGVMDLGATVCTARNPACVQCPVQDICVARQQGQPEAYPVKTRKIRRSAQSIWLMWAQNSAGAVWLARRPTPGVWAGLFCFPMYESREASMDAVPKAQASGLQELPPFTHVLTHKDLHLHVVRIHMPTGIDLSHTEGSWVQADAWSDLGLPAPVRKLLQTQ